MMHQSPKKVNRYFQVNHIHQYDVSKNLS